MTLQEVPKIGGAKEVYEVDIEVEYPEGKVQELHFTGVTDIGFTQTGFIRLSLQDNSKLDLPIPRIISMKHRLMEVSLV